VFKVVSSLHVFLPNSLCISLLSQLCHTSRSFYFPWFVYLNHIWWAIQFGKFHLTQFSPLSWFFLFLIPKYFPHYPVFEYPQPVFFSWYEKLVSRPYKTTGRIVIVCIFVFIFVYSKQLNGARGGAFGWGTALQAERSWVRYPMVSLEFFIDIILSAVLWPWGWLNL
jgi:hypothetical protein